MKPRATHFRDDQAAEPAHYKFVEPGTTQALETVQGTIGDVIERVVVTPQAFPYFGAVRITDGTSGLPMLIFVGLFSRTVELGVPSCNGGWSITTSGGVGALVAGSFS